MRKRRVDFIAHGAFKIHVIGNTVISEIQGPWNLQMLQSWAEAVKPLYAELGRKGLCGGISIHTQSVLTQPECIAFNRKLTEYAAENYNFSIYASVVAPDVEGSTLANLILAPICEGIIPFQVFPDFISAQKWVELQLAQKQENSTRLGVAK